MTMAGALSAGRVSPRAFRAALSSIPEHERAGWLDHVFALDPLPADDPKLPRGCVPYLPSPVESLLRLVELAPVHANDLFVDIGSGLGRAAALIHLLTGAAAIGIEIQPALAHAARALAARLNAPRLSVIEGDAAELIDQVSDGTVFFLYCPFSGARLERLLDSLEPVARAHPVRLGALDQPLPARPWLEPFAHTNNLTLYRSLS